MVIRHHGVVSKIARSGITHIRIDFKYDCYKNGIAVLVGNTAGDDVSKKEWRAVLINGGSVKIRLPRILSKYVGLPMVVYSDREPAPNEICRLNAVFHLDLPMSGRRKMRNDNLFPYFTETRSLVIPYGFGRAWSSSVEDMVVDATYVLPQHIDEGFISILFNVSDGFYKPWVYNLSESTNGYRTCALTKLSQAIESRGKDISNFKFAKAVKTLVSTCTLIFAEV
jgi:hypothetical protein